MTSDRYMKGLREFKKHFGKAAVAYLQPLEEIYPKFAQVNMEFPFGDLYADHKSLDARTRELVALAALTVLGTLPQMNAHIKAALRCGATETEILEVITQMTAYCGFPLATNALLEAGKAFKEFDDIPKK